MHGIIGLVRMCRVFESILLLVVEIPSYYQMLVILVSSLIQEVIITEPVYKSDARGDIQLFI